jgi:hypothetical protein
MEPESATNKRPLRITLVVLPTPYKVLATCIIATLAFGMLGAMGQIVVHDIIPTFYARTQNKVTSTHADMAKEPQGPSEARGDLFADLSAEEPEKHKPFYKGEQFIWTLKWTHIHLFGINMIFIFMGIITALLDIGSKFRSWLIALPFIGVFIDILAMWLKAFVSPFFFWLHIPGGGLFAIIFGYVSLRALWEMWLNPRTNPVRPART